MTIPTRITPAEAYKKVTSGGALLVCAYDSDEKYAAFKLEGSIPFSRFQSMEAALAKSNEIIFYCA
jgi:hypothetical protein